MVQRPGGFFYLKCFLILICIIVCDLGPIKRIKAFAEFLMIGLVMRGTKVRYSTIGFAYLR